MIAPVIIPIFALCIPIVIVITRSDIGRAIADAIRHNTGASDGRVLREVDEIRAELDQVRAEVDDLHTQLAESHERLDFAERMLSKPHETDSPSGGAIS